MHKTSICCRFIVTLKKCSTKQISNTFSKVFKMYQIEKKEQKVPAEKESFNQG